MFFFHGRSVSYGGLHRSFAQRIVQPYKGQACDTKQSSATDNMSFTSFTFKTPSWAMRNAETKRAPSTHKWNCTKKVIASKGSTYCIPLNNSHRVEESTTNTNVGKEYHRAQSMEMTDY